MPNYVRNFDVKNYYLDHTTIPQLIASNMSGCFFFLKHGAYGWYDQSNLLSTVKGRCYGNRLNDVLNVMTTSLPSILPLVAFPKALFSALYSSSCTPHLSVLLSLLFSSTTTFTQMILSSSSLSTHSTSTQAFLTFKTLFNTSLPG